MIYSHELGIGHFLQGVWLISQYIKYGISPQNGDLLGWEKTHESLLGGMILQESNEDL